jgi:hypothetical protein
VALVLVETLLMELGTENILVQMEPLGIVILVAKAAALLDILPMGIQDWVARGQPEHLGQLFNRVVVA